METKSVQNPTPPTSHNLTLTNSTHLKITGITKVETMSSTLFAVRLGETKLLVSGTDLNVTKLNIETGEADVVGKFEQFKYTSHTTIPLHKRLFK